MIACIVTSLITLNIWTGGKIAVRADEIESYQEAKCQTVEKVEHWYPSIDYKSTFTPCTVITMTSGQFERVKETADEIKNLMENKNGK